MRKIIITCLMVTMMFVNSVYAADTPLIERVDTAVNDYDEYIDISDNQLNDDEFIAVMTEYFAKYSSSLPIWLPGSVPSPLTKASALSTSIFSLHIGHTFFFLSIHSVIHFT